jgi:NAD-dependent DNA ligase
MSNLLKLLQEKSQQKHKEIKIPVYCPLCATKLHHVNALDTEAKIYMVYCLNCRFCKEWDLINGELKEV